MTVACLETLYQSPVRKQYRSFTSGFACTLSSYLGCIHHGYFNILQQDQLQPRMSNHYSNSNTLVIIFIHFFQIYILGDSECFSWILCLKLSQPQGIKVEMHANRCCVRLCQRRVGQSTCLAPSLVLLWVPRSGEAVLLGLENAWQDTLQKQCNN